MQIEITSTTFTLAPAGLLAVQDGAGNRVVVRSGVIWITQEGDVRDTIIGPGDELTTALETSCITLIEPQTRNSNREASFYRVPHRAAEAVACA